MHLQTNCFVFQSFNNLGRGLTLHEMLVNEAVYALRHTSNLHQVLPKLVTILKNAGNLKVVLKVPKISNLFLKKYSENPITGQLITGLF